MVVHHLNDLLVYYPLKVDKLGKLTAAANLEKLSVNVLSISSSSEQNGGWPYYGVLATVYNKSLGNEFYSNANIVWEHQIMAAAKTLYTQYI